MPSRPAILLILLGWLAALGWFAHRELWPVLFPGDSPPFVIELADEVTSEFAGEVKRPDVLWGIYRDDRRIGKAETRLRYFRDDNTFELETRIVMVKLVEEPVPIVIPELYNTYRLNRKGELLQMRMSGTISVLGIKGTATFLGLVHDGKVHRSGLLDIEFARIGQVIPKLDPIDAPSGSVLNPMHPVPKVKGLRPGRRWRMPILNPLGDAIQPALQAILDKIQPGQKFNLKLPTGPVFLDAEVLEETAEIVLNGVSHTCRIVEYRGDDRPARTYVRMSDGAVMRQEAYALGDRIVLQRE
jgi:hypothetical protein